MGEILLSMSAKFSMSNYHNFNENLIFQGFQCGSIEIKIILGRKFMNFLMKQQQQKRDEKLKKYYKLISLIKLAL